MNIAIKIFESIIIFILNLLRKPTPPPKEVKPWWKESIPIERKLIHQVTVKKPKAFKPKEIKVIRKKLNLEAYPIYNAPAPRVMEAKNSCPLKYN